jgi:hypothetical protein
MEIWGLFEPLGHLIGPLGVEISATMPIMDGQHVLMEMTAIFYIFRDE